jgi:23S rRNA pseudouridine1911/1915/1917 synthase
MLEILFEDAHFLVVNKPAGLLTQGRPGGETTLEVAVRSHLNPEVPTQTYLGTVHRLDRPVSGVVLWAKNPRAARRLAGQFESREAKKEYLAVVSNTVAPILRGVWEDWLCEEDTGVGVVQVCLRGTPRSRRAVTRCALEEAVSLPEGTSLLRLFPETGRTHQLRVQTGARGFPILGDSAYGSKFGFPIGIALHARTLTIRHPITEQWMTFMAPVPGAWQAAGIALVGDSEQECGINR